MDLRQQLVGLRRWLPLLLGCAVLGGVLAYFMSGQLQKTYEANTKLLVGQSLSAVNPDVTQLMASQRLSTTYAQIATTRPLLNAVADALKLDLSYDALRDKVHTSVAPDSSLLIITVDDTEPNRAAALANELAAQLIKASPDLGGQELEVRSFVAAELKATQAQILATQTDIDELTALPKRTPIQDQQLNTLQDRLTTLRSSYASLLGFASNDASNLLTIVDPAVAPGGAVGPRPLINAGLASLLSVLLATAVIVVATFFDRRLKSSDDVQEVTGLTTLGTIPRMNSQRGRAEMYQLAMLLYPRSAAAEGYRTLRANLEFSSVDSPVRTLLVTSPGPGEGKTVTASNLAIAFAQAGQRVLLVDADLRRPGIHTMFNVANTRGLCNLLLNEASWESVVQVTDQPNLRLLTTGPPPPNPAELLGTKRMRAVLERLRDSTDLLIIDSPPLLAVADSAILSSYVDGTLLVIDARHNGSDTARQARDALIRAGARVLGVLLNGLPVKDYKPYGAYYGTTPEEPDGRAPEASHPGSLS